MAISTSEMAEMRAVQQTFLPDTAVIQRATAGVDSIGEGTLAWAAIGTTACRVRPPGLRPNPTVVGESPETVAQWVITLPQDEDVEAGDRIVTGGYTFEVTHSWDEESWRTAVRVDAQRLE